MTTLVHVVVRPWRLDVEQLTSIDVSHSFKSQVIELLPQIGVSCAHSACRSGSCDVSSSRCSISCYRQITHRPRRASHPSGHSSILLSSILIGWLQHSNITCAARESVGVVGQLLVWHLVPTLNASKQPRFIHHWPLHSTAKTPIKHGVIDLEFPLDRSLFSTNLPRDD